MDEPDAPDWYLQEWMIHFGKKQSSLVNELGWLKGRANKFWHKQHSYRRELVNQLAAWLGIEPFELLMPPHEALALRRLRATAAEIVADRPSRAADSKPGGSVPERTGTKG
jgi:hypothetical protein